MHSAKGDDRCPRKFINLLSEECLVFFSDVNACINKNGSIKLPIENYIFSNIIKKVRTYLMTFDLNSNNNDVRKQTI